MAVSRVLLGMNSNACTIQARNLFLHLGIASIAKQLAYASGKPMSTNSIPGIPVRERVTAGSADHTVRRAAARKDST